MTWQGDPANRANQPGAIQGSGVLVGTAPPATARLTVWHWSTVITLSAANGRISFPQPFPNGVVSIQACPGDNASGLQILGINMGAISLSDFAVQGWTQTGGAISGAVRINCIAAGW